MTATFTKPGSLHRKVQMSQSEHNSFVSLFLFFFLMTLNHFFLYKNFRNTGKHSLTLHCFIKNQLISVCRGSKEPKIKQLHLLILGFQKSYLFCLLCNIVSPLMMPHVWTLTTPCVSHTWRINSCKHGCWIMKINSIIKTKTSISKLYNYLSTLLIINQPFMLYAACIVVIWEINV